MQPQPCPRDGSPTDGLGGKEGLEKVGEVLRRDTYPCVVDVNTDVTLITARGNGEHWLLAAFHGVYGVSDHIGEGLAKVTVDAFNIQGFLIETVDLTDIVFEARVPVQELQLVPKQIIDVN